MAQAPGHSEPTEALRTSHRARPIEAVVFDIGSVLINWNLRPLFRTLLPHDTAGLRNAIPSAGLLDG